MANGKGRGRGSSQHKGNSERWLLTYADLITLLLAFFVIMYGMSNADAQKFAQVASSMRKAFNVDVLKGAPSPGMLDTSTSMMSSDSAIADGAIGTQERDFAMISREMESVLQEDGLSDKVSFAIRPEGTSISISGNLLFASGKAELRPDAVKLLESLGRILAQLPNNVRIEGHTDDVPPIGTAFPSNWELSGARAIAVVRYLTEIDGIDPARLSAMAYSQYQPVAANDSARARGRNRRAEVLILYSTPSLASQPLANLEKNSGNVAR